MKFFKNICMWEITGDPSIPKVVFWWEEQEVSLLAKSCFIRTVYGACTGNVSFLDIRKAWQKSRCCSGLLAGRHSAEDIGSFAAGSSGDQLLKNGREKGCCKEWQRTILAHAAAASESCFSLEALYLVSYGKEILQYKMKSELLTNEFRSLEVGFLLWRDNMGPVPVY